MHPRTARGRSARAHCTRSPRVQSSALPLQAGVETLQELAAPPPRSTRQAQPSCRELAAAFRERPSRAHGSARQSLRVGTPGRILRSDTLPRQLGPRGPVTHVPSHVPMCGREDHRMPPNVTHSTCRVATDPALCSGRLLLPSIWDSFQHEPPLLQPDQTRPKASAYGQAQRYHAIHVPRASGMASPAHLLSWPHPELCALP